MIVQYSMPEFCQIRELKTQPKLSMLCELWRCVDQVEESTFSVREHLESNQEGPNRLGKYLLDFLRTIRNIARKTGCENFLGI